MEHRLFIPVTYSSLSTLNRSSSCDHGEAVGRMQSAIQCWRNIADYSRDTGKGSLLVIRSSNMQLSTGLLTITKGVTAWALDFSDPCALAGTNLSNHSHTQQK
jgi:hypothetical protein